MAFLPGTHPILDGAASADWERRRFDGNEAMEWAAMRQAGQGIAKQLKEDLAVAGVGHRKRRVLLLVGKGHNGGDAMLAASELLAADPSGWEIEVAFVFGENRFRPLALAAWRQLQGNGAPVKAIRLHQLRTHYDLILDGVFGFQLRPPLPDPARAWIGATAARSASLRVAIDLPSGLDEPGAFSADVTYATGILKTPVLSCTNAGRLRYLDLGFFTDDSPGAERLITRDTLRDLRGLRPAISDKRTFGHVLIIGGSRSYPGAVAMSVAAALHSGVGLVTACVPESIAPAMAARWPEAMWMGCAETPDGNIAIESGLAIRQKLDRVQAVLMGPGLSREPETLALIAELVRAAQQPLVLDADALQPELVGLGTAPRVLTPHAGEYERIKAHLKTQATWVVRKGSVTRLSDGGVTYHGIDGGPVLARGGSGDILAGLIAGRLAARPDAPALAAAEGIAWQGLAARTLAREKGEVAVRTTDILDYLNSVLRES